MQTVQMTSQELNLSQHDLVTSSRGLRVGLLQPPDTVVLSCLFQYGYLVVFTAFSGPMGAALPVRERTRLTSLARHHHSLAALNIAIMFSGARSAKIL